MTNRVDNYYVTPNATDESHLITPKLFPPIQYKKNILEEKLDRKI